VVPLLVFSGAKTFHLQLKFYFLSESNELISFMLAEKCNWYNLYNKPGHHEVSNSFDIQEYCNHRHTVIEIQCHTVHKPHTMKCHAVM